MNIAFVISIKIWGGVKTWMIEFGEALQKRGHQVVCFTRDQQMADEISSRGCTAYTLKFGADYNPVKIAYFLKKFREHQIDITCMNIQKELRTAGIAAKLLKIPVVQRIGLPTDINKKLDQRFAQRFLVDEILVTSQWMKEETSKQHHFTPVEKFTVVYNSKAVGAKPKISKNEKPRFVITSRLAVGKGHMNLIEAIRKVVEQGYTEFSCDVFGEGSEKEKLQEKVLAYNLQNQVNFKGFTRNLAEILKDYDFGVLVSHQEGFPNTVIEYMSVSLPCITTNIASLPEIVEHGINGYLYDYENIDELAFAWIDCLKMDSIKYAEFSAAAHNTIANRFNLEKNVQALESFFHKCIQKHKA